MVISNIRDIIEVDGINVDVGNEEGLRRKINNIIHGGHQKLQIVTDFDKTLTRFPSDTDLMTSWDIFWACPSVPQRCKDGDIRLKGKYRTLEDDATLSPDARRQFFTEWYKEAMELLIGVEFPREDLEEVTRERANTWFRSGVAEMINWSEKYAVPVLVFSAGQGDSVDYLMQAGNIHRPNVKVISNFLKVDEDDIIIGLKDEWTIRPDNKKETTIKGSEYYEMVKHRPNVIVIGDNIEDSSMAEGLDHCEEIIKIGLLNRRNVDKNLPKFKETFDIVLIGDPSFDVINTILNRLQ